MGNWFRESYLGQDGGVGQNRVIRHSSQSFKSISTLADSHPFGPHPFAVTHSQRHGPHAHSRELDLSPEADKLPTQSGNKNAKSERRATVGDKERSEMGADLGKQEMGHQRRASGMAAKEEQRWNRGIRDQARLGVTRRRQ